MLLLPELLPKSHNKLLKRPPLTGGLHIPIIASSSRPPSAKSLYHTCSQMGSPHQKSRTALLKEQSPTFLLAQPHIWSSAPWEPVPMSLSILKAIKLAQIIEGGREWEKWIRSFNAKNITQLTLILRNYFKVLITMMKQFMTEIAITKEIICSAIAVLVTFITHKKSWHLVIWVYWGHECHAGI